MPECSIHVFLPAKNYGFRDGLALDELSSAATGDEPSLAQYIEVVRNRGGMQGEKVNA